MAIQGNKIMNLEDGQLLYNDLRRRNERNAGVIEEVINTPSAVQTFDDGADGLPMALTVGIEPVQDLHGYDNPWPGGGGKNLFPYDNWKTVGIRAGTAVFNNNGVTLTATGSDCYTKFETPDYPEAAKIPVTAGETIIFTWETNTTDTQNQVFIFPNGGATGLVSAGAPSKTLSYTVGSGVTFVTFRVGVKASGSTVSYFNLMFRKSTDSSDFAPYSNICPISGWTGAKVSRTGKNIWDEVWEQGTIGTTGQNKADVSAGIRSKNYIPVVPGETYYVKTNGLSFPVLMYTKDKSYVKLEWKNDTTVTIPANIYFIRFRTDYSYGQVYNNDISINYPSTDTAYHAGHVAVYSIAFPSSAGTVYGGTLTVNKDGTGKLVVDKKNVVLNGSESWGDYLQGEKIHCAYLSISDKKIGDKTSICNEFQNVTGAYSNVAYGLYCDHPSQDKVFFRMPNESVTTLAEFKTWVASNNIQLVYELATPVTYTLTAEQVKTLLGVNNLFADCGSITEVRYPADTKLYVDQQIAYKISDSQRLMELIVTANHEDEMKATKAYSKDELLIVNGTLYKATTSIANGANLTVNTNVTATTVAAELAALA